MSKLIGVYGLLRRNHSQYNELGGQRMLCFRGIYRIPGYKMFSYKDEYPVAIHTHKKEDKMIVEVFITPNETGDKITLSESQAGYQEFTININEDKVSIFLYKGNTAELKEVPNGDWDLYVKTLGKVGLPDHEKEELPKLKVVTPNLVTNNTTTPVQSETPTEPSKPVAIKVKITIEDVKSLLCELNRDYISPKDLQTKFCIIYDKAKYFLDKFLLEKTLVKETITEGSKRQVVYKLNLNQ